MAILKDDYANSFLFLLFGKNHVNLVSLIWLPYVGHEPIMDMMKILFKAKAMRFYAMKVVKVVFLFCIIILVEAIMIHAQESNCINLGFEQGSFTNWVGHTWLYSSLIPSINTDKSEGFVFRRHTIISDTTAYDANTGGKLKKVPPGYRYSARLGDEINGTDRPPRCWEQSLRYTMTIDSNNAFLIIRFALVLQYIENHTIKEEPRFRFTLFGENGDTIPDCSNYDVYASNSEVKGFHLYIPENGGVPVQWRDWTTVGADLMAFMGQTITLEFMTADCTQQFHYGYAYFVAECHPLQITVHYCADDSVAIFTAPEGLKRYRWADSQGNSIDTTRILSLTDPVEGETYTCAMSSVTGCKVSLQSAVTKYILHTDFDSYMIDCFSNTVQLTNASTTTHGDLVYRWLFDDANTSSEKDPQHTFKTSGMHRVSLVLLNPPSTCMDTLIKDVESFSPPLVGIEGDSTYCSGLGTLLKAYGAYDYTWSDGSKNGTLEIGAPGGEYWLIGRSSTGCISDTIRISVSQEADWEFLVEADTTLCEGKSAVLEAYGAASYRWSTGAVNSSILVTEAGIYEVTGVNERGCEKHASFSVMEYPNPDVNFTLSESTLDSKHNRLVCSLPGQAGVQYLWDMGDGSFETGSTIHHTYNVSNDSYNFTITLTATSREECSDSTSRVIEVVPFIPNIFTPNGDGINDIFMEGFELEIIDRNGLSLYKGTGGWDGRYNGKPVDADTYFYRIDYIDKKEKVVTRKGFVILIK